MQQAAQGKGLLVNAVGPDVIRLAPPLTVSDREVDTFLDGFLAALSQTLSEAEAGGLLTPA